jgi:[acyl-carrier-protein] S-malonyltransferase
MAPAGAALETYFQDITFAQPTIPVLFNCLGDIKGNDVTIPELLVKQVQSSVYLEDSIRKMASMDVDALVEIGPGKVLTGFAKKIVPDLPVYPVETAADVESLVQTIKENDR